MVIGLMGLGKMGFQLALNMRDHHIDVIGYDVNQASVDELIKAGMKGATSLADLIAKLPKPRIIWVMVPAGVITERVIVDLSTMLDENDIVIDGGNSNYRDSIRRYELLKSNHIHFLDCGTSGGMNGARFGASLMIGGDDAIYQLVKPLFQAIAKENGFAHMGPAGSGHFVKMVHNGIEYGMMQAIGEGFDLLKASDFDLDYAKVATVWSNGSIIEGLLMNNIKDALSKDAHLSSIQGKVDDSGEGQWMIEEALKHKVSIPVIAQSLFARYKSKDEDHFSEKVVAAIRNEFGGHKVYKK